MINFLRTRAVQVSFSRSSPRKLRYHFQRRFAKPLAVFGIQFDAAEPSIPDYVVLRRIGRGGYGEVWLVRTITGLHRAAKVVWRDRFDDAKPYEREFKAIECYARVCLQDGRLLRVLHVGRNETGGYFYYIMELADNATARSLDSAFDPDHYVSHTLRYEMDRREFLPPDKVIQLGVELARAVQCLHDHGLIHRDIKPSNIVFVGHLPKLGDVGLVTNIREGVTQVGTEGYYPPEGPGQPSADVYALGKVLYELATGQPSRAFPILPDREIARADLPKWHELNEIILRAAEPRRAARYATAQELLNDLLLVEAGSSVRGWLRLRRQARWLKLTAALFVGVAGVALAIAKAERRYTRMAREELARGRYTSAQLEIGAGRYRKGRDLLEAIWKGPPKKGPLEWRMLYAAAHGYPDRVFLGPISSIVDLSISTDGSSIAARSSDNSLWHWTNSQTAVLALATNCAAPA